MTNATGSVDGAAGAGNRPTVGLFVTCLVDLFRPQAGFAAAELIEMAGCHVVVPKSQTCCGQPAHNGGDAGNAAVLARQAIGQFEEFNYVVAPSGSCAAMIKLHYPTLFEPGSDWHQRALALGDKTHELVSFLMDVRGINSVDAVFEGKVTYHDGCSGLRELGIERQPRALLSTVDGLDLVEMEDAQTCCGFGGTFCVKHPEISNRMVEDKVACIESTGAQTIAAGDLGCLLNIAGKLTRDGKKISARHIAEILAGQGTAPGIGE